MLWKCKKGFQDVCCPTFMRGSPRLSLPHGLSLQQKGKLPELTIKAGFCNPGFQESVRNDFTIDLKRYEEKFRNITLCTWQKQTLHYSVHCERRARKCKKVILETWTGDMTPEVKIMVQKTCLCLEMKCLEMSNLTKKLSFKFLLSPF